MNVRKCHVTENEQAIDKLKDTYLHWTKFQLEKLHSSLHLLERDDNCTPDKILTEISDQARNIRGLGGSFGYFLMTDIAFSLYRYIHNMDVISNSHLDIITAHVRAMDRVIFEEIEGGGGDRGANIVADLSRMIEKVND